MYAPLFDTLSINVTQFFRDETTLQRIQDTLLPTLLADKAAAYAALCPGGFLVLGKTETMAAEAKGRCITVDVKERMYRKPVDSPFFHGGQ